MAACFEISKLCSQLQVIWNSSYLVLKQEICIIYSKLNYAELIIFNMFGGLFVLKSTVNVKFLWLHLKSMWLKFLLPLKTKKEWEKETFRNILSKSHSAYCEKKDVPYWEIFSQVKILHFGLNCTLSQGKKFAVGGGSMQKVYS